VTLRKVSLQLADHHIGITHAGDGCSRLITDFDREQAIELGDAAHKELEAMKATEEKKKELEGLPKAADMARAPEEVESPSSLGGIHLDEPVEADELELEAESELADGDITTEDADELEDEDGTLVSLADRAEDSKEDMDDKLSVALPIEQEQRDELDARDSEEAAAEAEEGEIEIKLPTEDEKE